MAAAMALMEFARHRHGRRAGQPGAPPLHALLALLLARTCGLSAGNGALLMMLAASASYIAVPAVLRHAIPEARPALYFGMSLGLTFRSTSWRAFRPTRRWPAGG